MSTTESTANDVISLTFDKTKQLATLGHALNDEKFFNQLNRAVKPDYFSDPLVSKIWDACIKFLNANRRKPTPVEIVSWDQDAWKGLDSLNKAKLEATVQDSLAKSKEYGLDLLKVEFDTWIKGVLFVKTSMEAIELYKEAMALVGPAKDQRVETAWKRLDTGIISMKGSSFSKGVEIGFKPSSVRIIEEREERLADKDRILNYGVGFLDDVLLGMLPTELVVLGAMTGAGKCLGLGTQVLMYDGTVKRVEDVKLGDRLMGPDSKPRNVLGTCRDRGPLYKILPIKGDPWVCNDVHVLTLKNTTTGEAIDIPLDEYLQKDNKFKHLHKQFSVGVDFEDKCKDLPIDPYFLGVWYGDGSKTINHLGIDAVAITKDDREIVEVCHETARKWGLKVTTCVKSGPNRTVTHYLTGGMRGGQENPLLSTLRSVVGNLTEFPIEYLTGSKENRLQMLAGLLDTDGHMDNGGFDFVQKNKCIFDGTVFLARSVGLKVTVNRVQKGCQNGFVGDYWRMYISGDCSIIPTRLKRKQAPERKQVKDVLRTGFKIEALGEGEYAGFELDGDGRFLLGDFTVTHNTQLATSVALANSLKGKRIHYFALEAENNEIERRIKYGLLSMAYRKEGAGHELTYKNWRMCKNEGYQHVLDKLEDRMQDEFKQAVKGINTLYRTSGEFTVENLQRYLLQVTDETDLIVLDHLHYLDVEDNRNENEVYGECVKTLRNIVLNHRVPNITIAHLRKAQGGRASMEKKIPDIADFHGTSNITKISTTNILLAPDWDRNKAKPWLLPTYMKVVKNRLDGSVARYGASLDFNVQTGRYQNNYILGEFKNMGTEFEPLKEIPKWANVNGLPKL